MKRLGSHSYTYITDFIFDLPDMQQHGRVVDCGVASGLGLVVFQFVKYLKEKKKQEETMLYSSIYSAMGCDIISAKGFCVYKDE